MDNAFERSLVAQMTDHPGWKHFVNQIEVKIALEESHCRTSLIKSDEDAAKTNAAIGRIQAYREVLQIPDR